MTPSTARALFGSVLLWLAMPVMAAAADSAVFNPQQAFAPFDYPQPATAYRSASGKPGPA